MSGSRAFIFSGRLSRTSATPPLRMIWMRSLIESLPVRGPDVGAVSTTTITAPTPIAQVERGHDEQSGGRIEIAGPTGGNGLAMGGQSRLVGGFGRVEPRRVGALEPALAQGRVRLGPGPRVGCNHPRQASGPGRGPGVRRSVDKCRNPQGYPSGTAQPGRRRLLSEAGAGGSIGKPGLDPPNLPATGEERSDGPVRRDPDRPDHRLRRRRRRLPTRGAP